MTHLHDTKEVEVRHTHTHVDTDELEPQIVHEQERRVVESPGAEGRLVVSRITQLIWLAFGLLEALIGLRVFLKLIAANPNSLFAQFVYQFSEIFVAPFNGLTIVPNVAGFVLEIPAIIAMVVYAIAAWAITQLFWVLFYRPATRRVVRTHRDQM
jgi:hypothetical protein